MGSLIILFKFDRSSEKFEHMYDKPIHAPSGIKGMEMVKLGICSAFGRKWNFNLKSFSLEMPIRINFKPTDIIIRALHPPERYSRAGLTYKGQ